jgi:hypothetical protein
MPQTAERRATNTSRYRVFGLVVSFILHAGCVAGLLVVSFRPAWFDGWQSRQQRSIRVTMIEAPTTEDRQPETPAVRIVSSPSEVTVGMVRQRIDEIAERESTASDEETFQRLDELTKRLDATSSAESVDAMAGAMTSLLGTAPRATKPVEGPVTGEFDTQTAQFHDIRRVLTEDGGFQYLTVLLDAEGRTIEVPVDAATGERVYLTLERIKSNPLLEQIYRQIVMPLIDQMLAEASDTVAADSTATPKSDSEPDEESATGSSSDDLAPN